jgi:FlaA1/EpsC-like NDP-sugar epimerase
MINSPELRVVGYLDDDERLHGHLLNGLPIYNPLEISEVIVDNSIEDVLLALPSATRKRRNEILEMLKPQKVIVRTLPGLSDIATGKVHLSDLRELDIDDLLGRASVSPNHILLAKNITAKLVLVTGAGGSIGGELCRQILALGPEKLLLIEQSEFALYAIHKELEEKFPKHCGNLVPLLASVQDKERIHEILVTWRPNTIYHAAAYKHVPLVEHNPAEGVKNNVLGTLSVALAAIESSVSNFVLVSIDKAVRPTNVMGASKRIAEMMLQALAQTTSATNFSMVRFGNVLDSSGSVVPKFRKQIRDGGPVTVTHPEVTRFFMTIPEAAQLVIQAAAMAKGGDVFVLDMGESVRIMDLAERMIELSGLSIRNDNNPDGDIEVAIIGLRPGEKLFEELIIGHNPEKTIHPKIMRAQEDFVPWEKLHEQLNVLEAALSVNNVDLIQHVLKNLVPGYTPGSQIVDWVYQKQGVN